MLIQDEGGVEEHADLRQIATEEITGTFRAHNATRAFGQRELVLDVHDLTDVVQDLEAVDELATWLREIESRDHIGQELVLDTEITLEVLIEELDELLL